jgi:hypothetical protein
MNSFLALTNSDFGSKQLETFAQGGGKSKHMCLATEESVFYFII